MAEHEKEASLPKLTKRQYQVVRGLIRGLRVREIGLSVGISEQTVKNHLFTARKLTGARTTFQLVAMVKKAEIYGAYRQKRDMMKETKAKAFPGRYHD